MSCACKREAPRAAVLCKYVLFQSNEQAYMLPARALQTRCLVIEQVKSEYNGLVTANPDFKPQLLKVAHHEPLYQYRSGTVVLEM